MATSDPEDGGAGARALLRSNGEGRPVGIFGGTFDPIHNGHLRVALDAQEILDLDAVRLVPLARAVHREQPTTPAAIRLAMLRAAVAGRPQLLVDPRELERDGPSYTIDTLRSLHAERPDQPLCLLLGADAFNGFAAWREPDAILAIANIAILQRPDVPVSAAMRGLFDAHHVARLGAQPAGQIVSCPVAQLAIASSNIRQRLSSGRGIDYLVPDTVLELIHKHHLYL